MSERSYREATSPETLQRWHRLLRETASAMPDVETVHDEIADALDHVTGWTPGIDARENAWHAAVERDRLRFKNDPDRCQDCGRIEACRCGTRWEQVVS